MKTIKLNNAVEMPQMGYGVYQVTPEECERCVSDALSVTYRLIDTAQAYNNEEGVASKDASQEVSIWHPCHHHTANCSDYLESCALATSSLN
jgi:diketogulonate reductase-like aldo/keto reductase